MAEPWSQTEVDLCIDEYFAMLRNELDGVRYTKAEHRARLLTRIDRSAGSAEYKFQNVSAVLMELGALSIPGYKPAVNVQKLLRERVADRLLNAVELHERMAAVVQGDEVTALGSLADPSPVPAAARLPRRAARIPRHLDYQAQEAANRAVGLAGEELVVARERRHLAAIGRDDLARKVRHVSVEDGDGLGYDVLSWTPEGEKRFLEVKATKYSEFQPFLLTRNEVEFSEEEPERFSLVRVYQLERPNLGFYELHGPLWESAHLRSETFSAVPRAS